MGLEPDSQNRVRLCQLDYSHRRTPDCTTAGSWRARQDSDLPCHPRPRPCSYRMSAGRERSDRDRARRARMSQGRSLEPRHPAPGRCATELRYTPPDQYQRLQQGCVQARPFYGSDDFASNLGLTPGSRAAASSCPADRHSSTTPCASADRRMRSDSATASPCARQCARRSAPRRRRIGIVMVAAQKSSASPPSKPEHAAQRAQRRRQRASTSAGASLRARISARASSSWHGPGARRCEVIVHDAHSRAPGFGKREAAAVGSRPSAPCTAASAGYAVSGCRRVVRRAAQ